MLLALKELKSDLLVLDFNGILKTAKKLELKIEIYYVSYLHFLIYADIISSYWNQESSSKTRVDKWGDAIEDQHYRLWLSFLK